MDWKTDDQSESYYVWAKAPAAVRPLPLSTAAESRVHYLMNCYVWAKAPAAVRPLPLSTAAERRVYYLMNCYVWAKAPAAVGHTLADWENKPIARRQSY